MINPQCHCDKINKFATQLLVAPDYDTIASDDVLRDLDLLIEEDLAFHDREHSNG